MANGDSSAADSTAVLAALELKEALPSNITMGPYKSYELNTLRTVFKKPIRYSVKTLYNRQPNIGISLWKTTPEH